MAIKVAITRRVPADLAGNLRPMLLQLRSLAMAQPGYISGETLINADDHEEFLVLSTWTTIEQWTAWAQDARRITIEKQIDDLLGQQTVQKVYFHG